MKMIVGCAALALTAGAAMADFTEGFEANPLTLPGWSFSNQSNPNSGAGAWFLGNNSVFGPNSGNQYVGSNWSRGTGVSTLSCWMITPEVTLTNGDVLSFYSRTVSSVSFPDRMQVRMSTAGASVNTGTSETDVGDFSTLLLDINSAYSPSGYPNAWTQYVITVSGLSGSVQGRFAFRYFVEDGGPSGNNSDYIGVDDVDFKQIPAPASLALMGVGALAAGRRRR